MFQLLFWLAVLILAYTYIGFPVLTFLRSVLHSLEPYGEEITPSVSLMITAYNEAGVIRKKLENVLSLDYPASQLEVIVASDGSNDGTHEIVAQFRDRGVKLLAFPRRGKIPTLNQAVPQARGEILVFSDANSIYERGALRALVRPFADASVGGVAGDQRYVKRSAAASTAGGECAYWDLDRMLKRWQSHSGSVTSATGAIYAIRREFFRPLPGGVCDDAMASYQVIAQGGRMVFAPEAIAWEHVAGSAEAEYRRKVRVCARGLRGLVEARELFNPSRFGFYSVQLLSHKLLRWLAVWPLALLLVASLALIPRGGFYAAAALAQVIFYGLAWLTDIFHERKFFSTQLGTVLAIPYYFCLVNVAFLVAQLRFLEGRRIDRWDVQRGTSGDASGTAFTPTT